MQHTKEQYIDWANELVKALYNIDPDICIELVQCDVPDDQNQSGCILHTTYTYPFTPAEGTDRNRCMQWSVSRLTDLSLDVAGAASRIHVYTERYRRYGAQYVLNIPMDSPLFDEAYKNLVAQSAA